MSERDTTSPKTTANGWLVLAIALLFLPSAAHGDDAGRRLPEPAPTLKPMSRAEIATALKTGAVITSRSIDGGDIAALVLGSSGSQKQCDPHRALRIQKSYIHGDITIEPERKGEETKSNVDEKEAVGNTQEPTAWVPISISINGSSIQGQLSISKLGFACPTDFGDSTFHARLNLRRAVFSASFSADGGVFKEGVEAISSQWKGPATFRRAQFIANAEFFPGSEPTHAVFVSDADFQDAVFHRLGNFRTSRFEGHTNFRYAQFMGEALFDHIALGAGPKGYVLSGPFYMTDFAGRSSFRGATFKSLTFFKTIFRNGVELDSSQGRSLLLMRPVVGGRIDFSDAKIDRLHFQGSMTVEGDAIFRRAQVEDVSLALVVFRKTVDLQGVHIRSKLTLRRIAFEGDVHLEDALLPLNNPENGQTQAKRAADATEDDESFFSIEDTTLNGGLYAGPQQILAAKPAWEFRAEQKPRFTFSTAPDPDETADFEGTTTQTLSEQAKQLRTWRELKHAFQTAGNLQLQNYAEYHLRALEENEQTGLSKVSSIFSRIFWGYGLRPLRVVFWLAAVILLFAGVYFTQLGYLYADRPSIAGFALRAKAALSFSSKTAWQFKYGYENSTRPTFQAITLLESALGKLLLACFAYSLSHTSPLLDEIMKKLIP